MCVCVCVRACVCVCRYHRNPAVAHTGDPPHCSGQEDPSVHTDHERGQQVRG